MNPNYSYDKICQVLLPASWHQEIRKWYMVVYLFHFFFLVFFFWLYSTALYKTLGEIAVTSKNLPWLWLLSTEGLGPAGLICQKPLALTSVTFLIFMTRQLKCMSSSHGGYLFSMRKRSMSACPSVPWPVTDRLSLDWSPGVAGWLNITLVSSYFDFEKQINTT